MIGTGRLLLLIDREWKPDDEENPNPPLEVVLGGWEIRKDGSPGLFRANPAYRPTSEWSPYDPVDAVLRTIAGAGTGERALGSVLRGALLTIATDEQGVALIRPSPDGLPCVLVATAHGLRADDEAARWVDISVGQLAAVLPEQGVDVLLNPGSAASMRLRGDAVRAIAAGEH